MSSMCQNAFSFRNSIERDFTKSRLNTDMVSLGNEWVHTCFVVVVVTTTPCIAVSVSSNGWTSAFLRPASSVLTSVGNLPVRRPTHDVTRGYVPAGKGIPRPTMFTTPISYKFVPFLQVCTPHTSIFTCTCLYHAPKFVSCPQVCITHTGILPTSVQPNSTSRCSLPRRGKSFWVTNVCCAGDIR